MTAQNLPIIVGAALCALLLLGYLLVCLAAKLRKRQRQSTPNVYTGLLGRCADCGRYIGQHGHPHTQNHCDFHLCFDCAVKRRMRKGRMK